MKKKLLFIGVGFGAYDHQIIDSLSQWYDVFYFDSTEFDKKITKWIFLFQKLHIDFIREWFNARCISKRISKLSGISFSKIFLLKGEHLTHKHMQMIKKLFPEAELSYYTWDCWHNIFNQDVITAHFPVIHSFDSEDCKKYGFKLRPLFYTDSQKADKKTLDVSFVGRGQRTPVRFLWLKEMKKLCQTHGLKYFFSLQCGKGDYYRWKHKDGILQPEDEDLIANGSIPYSEFKRLLKESRCIVDFPFPKQSGLTIRSIEALAVGTKIVTSNVHIAEYEDIPECSYFILTKDYNKESLMDFIRAPFPEKSLSYTFHLESLLKDVVNIID